MKTIAGKTLVVVSMFVPVIAQARVINLPETTDLCQAVADARAAYDTKGGEYYQEPVTINLAPGDYAIASEIIIDWPLVLGGSTGDPSDVNVIVESKYDGQNARVTARAFALNDSSAKLHSLTVKNGYFVSTATYNVATKAQGLGVVRICGLDGNTGVEWTSKAGNGGVVSNVVLTASSIGDGKSGCGLLYVAAPDALVTHCRVIGNAAKRSRGTAGTNVGLFVVVNDGVVRNTLVADNEVDSAKTSSHPDVCYAIASVLAKGRMVNCTIVGNNCIPSDGSDTYGDGAINACAGVIALGTVVNTLIYGNQTTSAKAHFTTWAGAGENFISCAGDFSAADKPSESCLTLTASPFVAADDYRPDKASPCCGAGLLSEDYPVGETDLGGAARTYVDGGVEKVDVGAYQHSLSVLVGTCTFTGSVYDSVPTLLAAHVDEGALGDAPVYYWDWESDGVTDLVTTEASFARTFCLGDYHLTVCASNAEKTVGYSFVFEEGFSVGPHPTHYFDPASANPTAPYTTPETAAHDIQSAIDAARPGAEVSIAAGTHRIACSLDLTTDCVWLHGATADPADTVIRPDDGVYCRCLLVDAGPRALVSALTFEAGRGGSGATDQRTNGGGGACLNIALKATDGNTDSPESGRGGIVSNCIVRCGRYGENDDSSGAGKKLYQRSGGTYLAGPNALLTHCVISNNNNNSSTSSEGYMSAASALAIWNGARAENCLIAGNKSTTLAQCQSTVTVGGEGAVLRHSTVVGNTGRKCGGVNVVSGGRFEACVLCGNSCVVSSGRFLPRHNVWSAFDYGRDVKSTDTDYDAEVAKAAEVGVDQINDASTMADAGLGAGYVSGTAATFFADAANGDYSPARKSPLLDRIAPADEPLPMPARDLAGKWRLSGTGYDIGAYERQKDGLMLLIQ